MQDLVNPYWLELKNMVKLAEYMQTKTAKNLTDTTCEKVCKVLNIRHEKAMSVFLEEWVKTAKKFIKEIFSIIEDDVKRHAYKYPLNFWPATWYDTYYGRQKHEKVLELLRKIPLVKKTLEPGKIREFIPPVILPGVDYSAESLVFNGFLKSTKLDFDKSKLEWMREDARADYAYGVVCLGSEDYEILTKAWVFGEVHTLHSYVEALDTLVEETLHFVADQISKNPKYNYSYELKEHYWLNEYGVFPEKVYDAITSVSSNYIGCLKRLSK